MQPGKGVRVGIVLFALPGPPIGALLHRVLAQVAGLRITSEGLVRLPSRTDAGAGRLGRQRIPTAALSYLIGTVPAALTGAVVGALRHRLGAGALVAVGMLAGAGASLVAMALWMRQSSPDAAVGAGLDLLPYGACAAAMLSWLFCRRAGPGKASTAASR